MKRIIMTLCAALLCLAAGGCSLKKEYELHGKAQVEALRAEAKTWRSGRYLLTNLDTDIMNQAFSFMYNADGSQSFFYESIDGEGGYYAEYSDGASLHVVQDGMATVFKEGAEGYVSYSEESPHPYSTGDLLFYENLFVKSSEEENPGENVLYRYYYNTDKINETLGTSLTSFVTEYVFDGGGNFLYFTQSSESGGESYAYRIEVIDVNGIERLDNPLTAAGE